MCGESYDVWGGSSFLIPSLYASPDPWGPCFYQNPTVGRFKNISVTMSTSKTSVFISLGGASASVFFKKPLPASGF